MESANAGLARYTGLIEQARANNRQGFPVGAAYQRQANERRRRGRRPTCAWSSRASATR